VNVSRADPIHSIAAAPYQWDYFHALRCIDAFHADKPRLGTARRPADEAVRLGQPADLSFAPAAIANVALDAQGGVPRIDVRFFGLFGPNGPLPLHLTAYARERSLHKGDRTLQRFADLFHHRLLLLFYRAWAQAQPTVNLDRPAEDRYAEYVGSMIGVGGPEWRHRDAAPTHAKLFFAGTLARQVRNADGLQALVSGYLRMPVRVESFVGRWMRLLPAERTRIGRRRGGRHMPAAQLGSNAVLGGAVFDRQHHFRLHVGPVDAAAFEALLPTGRALPAVKALVDHYVGLEYGWDLQIQLRPDARTATRLGRQGRLGWTTWIGALPAGQTPTLTLHPEARPASS
jgi:type VI secretion system protein ImpH